MFLVPVLRLSGLFLPAVVDIPEVELRWCWIGIVTAPWSLWARLEVVLVDIILQ